MGAPSTPPVAAVAPLVAEERSRLLDLLTSVDDAHWERPTPCPGWSVHGLACHLLGDDLGLLARRRDGFLGTPAPAGLDEPGFVDWLDRLQDDWVHAARRISPALVVELLGWTGPRLVEVLGAEDLSAPTSPVTWAGPDPAPVWLDQIRELSEFWIHRQQLLEALGRPADLDPDLLVPILAGLRWAYPFRLSTRLPADPASSGTVVIRVGPPIDETWWLVSDGRGWTFDDSGPADVVAEARLDPDETWRLLTNNLRVPVAQLDITGDPVIVEVLRSTRAIIGHPQAPEG